MKMTSKPAIEKINLGPSLKGISSVFGWFLLVFSVILFLLPIFFLIPLIFLGISVILILSYELIEINYNERKIRKVLYLVLYKHGEWKSLDNFNKLLLAPNHEAMRMISPAHPIFQKDITFRAYDIYLFNTEDINYKLLLCSSKEIPIAQKKLKEYAEKLNVEMEDTIKEGWLKNRNRRRTHKRR